MMGNLVVNVLADLLLAGEADCKGTIARLPSKLTSQLGRLIDVLAGTCFVDRTKSETVTFAGILTSK